MHRYQHDENCPNADALEARQRTGKRCLIILAAMLVVMLVSAWLGVVQAQTVPGSMTLRWTLPTTGCTIGVTPCDSRPLTGTAALQAVHVWISTSPIPDSPSGAPTLTLSATATTATHTLQVTAGQTLYARVSVRNPSGDSPLSNQVTRLITLPVLPNMPTNVTIELTITP